jgi:hypothetical protein
MEYWMNGVFGHAKKLSVTKPNPAGPCYPNTAARLPQKGSPDPIMTGVRAYLRTARGGGGGGAGAPK